MRSVLQLIIGCTRQLIEGKGSEQVGSFPDLDGACAPLAAQEALGYSPLMAGTETDPPPRDSSGTADVLTLIFHRELLHESFERSWRWVLSDVNDIHIGRREQGQERRQDTPGVWWLGLDDTRASENHARLERRGDFWVLLDRGSSNRTWLNGRPLEGPRRLYDRDVIMIGSTFFMLRLGQPFKGDEPFLRGNAQEVPDKGRIKAWRTFNLPLEETYRRAASLAQGDCPILLLGPTGTGKERFAAGIHEISPRAELPYEVVNCPLLHDTIFAHSHLFGHERGAFTGADRQHFGQVHRAGRGTLFLDEVADLPLQVQVALHRLLDKGEYALMKGKEVRNSEARILSGTSQDLTASGARLDWIHRLGASLTLPPLVERLEDLGLIAAGHFKAIDRKTRADRGVGADREKDAYLSEHATLGLEAQAAWNLLLHGWPGNIRQLTNLLDQASLCRSGRLATAAELGELPPREPGEVPPRPTPTQPPLPRSAPPRSEPPEPASEDGETLSPDALQAALAATGGNVQAAARQLGYNRQYIHTLLKKWGINPAPLRKST
jgi:DNA-binding NtrC family response regulator